MDILRGLIGILSLVGIGYAFSIHKKQLIGD